jgi:hypothetical protein
MSATDKPTNEQAAKVVPSGKSWRDLIKIHPEANKFPLLDQHKLIALGDDIKATALRLRAVLVKEENGEWVLGDGRNRLDAMEAVGMTINLDETTFEKNPTDDPVAYIRSLNVHRRHLDREWIDKYLAGLIQANSDKSDRSIAAEAEKKTGVKVDKNKVGKQRQKMEGRGEVAPRRTRTDTKGREQPAKKRKLREQKPPPPKKKKPSPAPAPKPSASGEPNVHNLQGHAVKDFAAYTIININKRPSEYQRRPGKLSEMARPERSRRAADPRGTQMSLRLQKKA